MHKQGTAIFKTEGRRMPLPNVSRPVSINTHVSDLTVNSESKGVIYVHLRRLPFSETLSPLVGCNGGPLEVKTACEDSFCAELGAK